ncbi:MAG: carbamoyl-phosphate synthase large subunit, partial [Bacteroidetes bacterium]|nr:carbamoyl-phosphate synthase large subunit [Bacteroidota bacterium]
DRTDTSEVLYNLKRHGYSDIQIAWLVADEVTEEEVRDYRLSMEIQSKFLLVDTCAGEFPALTPYFYSSYESGTESEVSDKEKIIILGSGPNRIGQGIEFDYSCVHGVQAVQEMGYEAIMVNCNPETVSTDFDIADKLYFEPVFWERVFDIIEHEEPAGVIVQLGGQTALKLAGKLSAHGIKIFGTPFERMDLAENRGKFSEILKELDIPFPPYGIAKTVYEAVRVAESIGYPILVRPSYVLGGQGMRIAINKEEVERYVTDIYKLMPDNEILLDLYLNNGIEIDVDAVRDADGDVWITGIMQHIEPAGVHSGDSTAVLPPHSLNESALELIRKYSILIANYIGVVGLMNVQLVVQGDAVYVIEANPRASRTVPFVAKATGIPVARIASKVILGAKLEDFRSQGLLDSKLEGYAIKEPVFSWSKFPEVRKELGPEMKSTGETIAFVDALTDRHYKRPYEMRNLYLSR